MAPTLADRLGRRAAAWFAAALTVAACGGDESRPPSEGRATIGAPGDTVDGPDGTLLVVPAGVLDADITIRVACSTDGGATWARVDVPVTVNLSGVAYSGSGTDVVAVGDAGTILRNAQGEAP